VAAALLAATAPACGGDGSPATVDDESPALAVPSPADGEYDGGRFRFGRSYSGGPGDADTLAAYAWDIVSYLEDGEIGSWSAGHRVFESSDRAEAEARELAHRWPCADDPVPLEDIDAEGFDFLEGSSCRGLLGEGRYVAQVSAARGSTTTNLVVGASSRGGALAAVEAVWQSLSEAVRTAVPPPS
jgi:hypothetical protein